MKLDLALSFDNVDPKRAASAARLVRLVPSLARGGTVATCDIGVDARKRRIRFRARLTAGVRLDELVERATFWAARGGGRAGAIGEADDFVATMLACEALSEEVPAEEAADAILTVFPSAAGIGDRVAPTTLPVLVLRLGGPGHDGVTYDADRRVVFMPSPLSPPVGDELLLELHRSGRRAPPVRAQSRVIDARAFRRARPGHPAGFWLSIGDHAGAHALLADRCAGGAQYEARRASQRFPVRGRVLVRAVDGSGAGSEGFTEARLRNLSMGGLFVRGRPRASGERVEIETFLPTGVALRSKGTVAHVAADGFGVRFDQDADGAVELALAAMLAGLSGVSRRVLLVDDDPLALAMLEDAFRARGWEVATVADASEGLQLLTDSLFALDLLVTDVMMRDVDGEELVRRIREAGGEGDLPILAVTASPTLELCDRLRACGADEVASKGAGIERIVDAAEALVASRRAAEARPVGAGAEGRAA